MLPVAIWKNSDIFQAAGGENKVSRAKSPRPSSFQMAHPCPQSSYFDTWFWEVRRKRLPYCAAWIIITASPGAALTLLHQPSPAP